VPVKEQSFHATMTDHALSPILSDPNRGWMRWVLHSFYGAIWWTAILLGSPWWLVRSSYDRDFRQMVLGRLGFGLPKPPLPGENQRVLIHGVSVGEVKAAQALVLQLEEERPDLEVVISTVTDTGLRIATELYPGRKILRFPVDPGWIVSRFLRRVAPTAVVLVELEIWPNFLRAANRAGIPVAVVNGRITERSFRSYCKFRNLLPQFNRISLYCVQGEQYGERFRSLSDSPERILITGNVKADSLGDGKVAAGDDRQRLLEGRAGQLILCAGSTHDDEESTLVKLWREHFSELRLILVPRHPRRSSAIIETLLAIGEPCQLLSELRGGLEPDPLQPVLVDSIGELESIYGLSDLVFVGGSLVPHGGQNMLEPASQGLPVVYGPHVDNFTLEAGLLEQAGAAVRVASPAELAATLLELMASRERRERMARAGLKVVQSQKGATRRTLDALCAVCLSGR
jgi:3-deoxy-D-manno-octulosonic-acid transferase